MGKRFEKLKKRLDKADEQIKKGECGDAIDLDTLLKDHDFWKPDPLPIRVFYRVFGKYGLIRTDIPFWFRETIQKIFRKDHISDSEVWNLNSEIIKFTYPRLKRFIASERLGYPNEFVEYEEGEIGTPFKSKEEYEKAIKDGRHIGGGPDKWEEVLHKIMVFVEFEYIDITTSDDKIYNDYYKRNGFDLKGYCPYGQPGYEEFRRAYEEGLELFGKFFLSFWD